MTTEPAPEEKHETQFVYLVLPAELYLQKNISPHAILLWARIRTLCLARHKACTASNRFLAKERGLKVRWVQTLIAELKAAGLLRVEIDSTGTHRQMWALGWDNNPSLPMQNNACLPMQDTAPLPMQDTAPKKYSTEEVQIEEPPPIVPSPPKPRKDNRPTTEISQRIATLFGRRLTTAWADKEISAYKAIGPIDVADLELIEAYYDKERAKGKEGHHRRDLATFLNNFRGELDRANGSSRRRREAKEEEIPDWVMAGMTEAEWREKFSQPKPNSTT